MVVIFEHSSLQRHVPNVICLKLFSNFLAFKAENDYFADRLSFRRSKSWVVNARMFERKGSYSPQRVFPRKSV